ncbi:hypothetical protein PRO82_000461 [Candidatus Protochlamydia amoebophila]|nr:hypothetical protein [Candidatus Protochlamydia amoebophila]
MSANKFIAFSVQTVAKQFFQLHHKWIRGENAFFYRFSIKLDLIMFILTFLILCKQDNIKI